MNTDDQPEESAYSSYTDVVWGAFMQMGKLQYWVPCGRSRTVIGSDGKARTEFYFDRHAVGGSTWLKILPPGEKPAVPKPQPKRPAQPEDADDEL
jgi:hypothetical protein